MKVSASKGTGEKLSEELSKWTPLPTRELRLHQTEVEKIFDLETNGDLKKLKNSIGLIKESRISAKEVQRTVTRLTGEASVSLRENSQSRPQVPFIVERLLLDHLFEQFCQDAVIEEEEAILEARLGHLRKFVEPETFGLCRGEFFFSAFLLGVQG